MIAIPAGYYLIVTYILTGLVGLAVGSFLNVVIYRVPHAISLAKPASHCPKCQHPLRWYDNIPVLSYVMLGGRCRYCKDRITPRYCVVELLNTMFWLLSVYLYHDNFLYAVMAMWVSSVSLCICFTDWENMWIPDRLQLALIVPAVTAVFLDQTYSWVSHVIGAVVPLVIFVGLALVMRHALGREALGGGDIKLAILSGLFLGWEKFLMMILFASVTGSIVMLIRKKKTGESRETAFAPFLTAGLLLSLFAGDFVINAYIDFLFGII